MASLAHSEVKQERHQVSGEVDEQDPRQPDVVVNESNDGPGNQPSTLDSCQQKSVGVDELFSGS